MNEKQDNFQVSIIPRDVKAVLPAEEAVSAAKAIQQAYATNLVFDIKIGGKYSHGSAVAIDPTTDEAWLLKPETSKFSPVQGVKDQLVSKSRREAAFSEIGRKYVSPRTYPNVQLLTLDGHETAAIKLGDPELRNISFLQRLPNGKQGVCDVFHQYQHNGELWKWLFFDYVLGNTDRHSNNIMINKETGEVSLIDHGGAFAGENFDPLSDGTFTPYYLRCGQKDYSKKNDAKERRSALLKPTELQEKELRAWALDIHPDEIKQTLAKYGFDPKPFIDRLEEVISRRYPTAYILDKWSGVIPNTPSVTHTL